MNTRTRQRTDRCSLTRAPARPWIERSPPLAADDEPDETMALDELEAEALDAMDEDWPPDSLEDFLDRFD